MNLEELRELIKLGESDGLEFKKSTAQLNRAYETLCAFLNGHGGKVLIGVTSGGEPTGQQVSDSTLRNIAEMTTKFEPPAHVSVSRIGVSEERDVLVLEVEPTDEAVPYAFSGRAYMRVGPTTQVMPRDEYRSRLLAHAHSGNRWENSPMIALEFADLDQDEVLRTVRAGREAGRLTEASGDAVRDILLRLGLSHEGALLQAAIVLFGTRFLPHYPQCQLRMARFRGTDKSEFLDQRQLHGHAFRLLDESMIFLRRHLPVAGRIQPGIFERQDEPLFPLVALREALVNAFCHRDYSVPGGAVSLAVFDDRLEVWSDGTLPFGLKVEDLKREHPSKPRNPIISNVFYLRGLVERWGRGTEKIVELCVRAGHPEPEFIEQAGAVAVRFLAAGYTPPLRVDHDLTNRQREILHIVSRRERIPLREIMAQMTSPPPTGTVREDLALLKKLGLIESRGHGRGAYWILARDRDAEKT